MALDRYIAICHSFSEGLQKLRSHKVAYAVTAFVWVLCICLCIPVMVNTNVQGIQPTCKCRYGSSVGIMLILSILPYYTFIEGIWSVHSFLGKHSCVLYFCSVVDIVWMYYS